MNKPLLSAAVLTALAGSVYGQARITAPFGPGGTWNVYEANPNAMGWTSASNYANSQVFASAPGHLVSVHSADENTLAFNLAGGGDIWIGLFDNPAVLPTLRPDQQAAIAALPAAQQPAETGTPAEGSNLVPTGQGSWAWTSGEPFTYANWSGGEPNNFASDESVAHIGGAQTWNDNSANLGIDPANGDARNFKSVIEYETQSALPVQAAGVGVLGGAVDNNQANIWAAAKNGYWHYTEIRNAGGIGDLATANNVIDNTNGGGAAVVFQENIPVINLADDTNGGGRGLFRSDNNDAGGLYRIPDRQFISGTDNVDENDVAYIARTRVRVDNPGDYTFGVHSDDGFQLTIAPADSGAPIDWSGVSGAGTISGGNILNFPTGTGDSNTRGVVNLGTGYYDIEMRGWEGGGGAFWELYSAPGSFANDGDTQLWALVGQKPEVMYPGIDAAGWSVNITGADVGVPPDLNSIADAQAALANGTPFTATGVSVINFEGNGGTGAGIFGGNTAWPGGFPGGDQTDFAMSASGALVIGEDGTYQFGFQGDDGGMLEIRDGDGNIVGFRSTSDDDNDASLVRNGQLVADYNTGNSRTVGLIDLMAGTYTINGLFWERGGGDNFEIFGAPEGAPLELLAQNGAILRTIQGGLQIAVPEPSRAFLLVLGAVALIARRRR